MIACSCTIWHKAEPDCGCACHYRYQTKDGAVAILDTDEIADLAIIACRVKDGEYADDTAPLSAYGVVYPWRIAMEGLTD